jgi:hypothetical protein
MRWTDKEHEVGRRQQQGWRGGDRIYNQAGRGHNKRHRQAHERTNTHTHKHTGDYIANIAAEPDTGESEERVVVGRRRGRVKSRRHIHTFTVLQFSFFFQMSKFEGPMSKLGY